ncbi:hypothetical protein V6N11_019393 [Hibiscus sabdariffa]|uniref:Uncharacterized protein n=1 Tax=Hibiscus sabdariffa TaxID=183260 RepID=A0ABR2R294_9ROSI
MADITSMIAKLHFTKEDFDDMDTLQFEEDHHVEGSEKWVGGKVLTPLLIDNDMLIRVFKPCSLLPEGETPEFQYGTWLKVESTRPNQDNVKKPKQSIVFTKHVEPTVVNDEVFLVIRTQNSDRRKGVGSSSSTSKGSKRTNRRKDGDVSNPGEKKARSISVIMGNGTDEGHEDSPPQMAISLVETAGQLHWDK